MKFVTGFVTAILVAVVAGGAFLVSGSFNTSAVVPPGTLEKRLAGAALDRSVARRAPKAANPIKPDAESSRRALSAYKEMCLLCHGAPGVDASEVGEGLNPPAPDLTLAKVQKRSDGELFWIVQNGIRMTGMPAFGPTHKDPALWNLVAFLRHLPELTAEEQAALKKGEESGEAHEHEHGEDHADDHPHP